MKIKISYIETERFQVANLLQVIVNQLPNAKQRETNNHPPYKHIYLTIKEPRKRNK